MNKLKVLDLFSGIGGFSLGLERTGGFKTVAFCEIEEFPRKVLNKHWPGVPIAEDIRELRCARTNRQALNGANTTSLIYNKEVIYDGSIDVITGGFPCQDISVAGKQKGIKAERSGLWTELARLISEVRPKYAIVENVTALLSGERGRWFQRVLGDLAEIGYDTEWHCIPASELGAHHHRDRVWIICYPQHTGRDAAEIREGYKKGNGSNSERKEPASEFEGSGYTEVLGNSTIMQRNVGNDYRENSECEISEPGNTGSKGNVSDTNSERLQRREEYGIFGKGGARWEELVTGCVRSFDEISQVEPTICGDSDGLSDYAHRLKGLGNAVYPQIPELFGRAILEAEHGGMCNV